MTDKLFLLLGSSLGSSSHHRCSRHSSHHRCFGVILVVAGIGLLLAGGVEATLSTASSSTTKTTAFAHSSKKYRNVGEGLVSLSSKSSSLHGSKIPYGGTTTEDQDGSFVEGFTDDENLPTNTENIVSRTPSSIIADYCRGRGGATFKKTVVQGGGSASITNLIFNLVKNILGAGVLGLPAGKVEELRFGQCHCDLARSVFLTTPFSVCFTITPLPILLSTTLQPPIGSTYHALCFCAR